MLRINFELRRAGQRSARPLNCGVAASTVNNKSKGRLFMKQHVWKIRLVLLWVFLAVNYTALLFIEAANGVFTFPTNESTSQYVIAVFYFIPCLMAWLSLVLAPSISRWPNIAIALLLFILKVLGAASIIAPASPGMAINESIASILAALIILYSWKMPAADSNERHA